MPIPARRLAVSTPNATDAEPVTRKPGIYSAWASTTRSGKPKTASARSKSKTISASSFDRTKRETEAMIASEDFAACEVRHLVALYDAMHLKIYGLTSTELADAKTRFNTTMMAKRFVDQHCQGDVQAVVDYMQWLWTAEIGLERWRQANGVEGRITPYNQFSPAYKRYGDYRKWATSRQKNAR